MAGKGAVGAVGTAIAVELRQTRARNSNSQVSGVRRLRVGKPRLERKRMMVLLCETRKSAALFAGRPRASVCHCRTHWAWLFHSMLALGGGLHKFAWFEPAYWFSNIHGAGGGD